MEEDAVLIDEDKQEKLDLNFHTDMPVGEILRRTRMHYGQSLPQIESVLRIRASQLAALESGDVSQLPGRVYALGFVRSYSEYLGLDGDKMVQLFKEQHGGRQKKPDLSFPVPASESKTPNVMVVVGSILAVLVLIGFIAFMMFPEGAKNEIPTVPEDLTQSRLNEAPSLVAQAPVAAPVTPAVPPAAAPVVDPATGQVTAAPSAVAAVPGAVDVTAPAANANRIVLEVIEPSWIEIRNAQGSAILRQVLKPGDIYLVPPEPGLIMATGNAGGVRLKVDGRELPPLGDPGQIKRKIPLDPALLLRGRAP